MKENILIDKSISFAARIIKLSQYLTNNRKESIISKQIVSSETSIGANINEANYGQSKAILINSFSELLVFLCHCEGVKRPRQSIITFFNRFSPLVV